MIGREQRWKKGYQIGGFSVIQPTDDKPSAMQPVYWYGGDAGGENPGG